ncbi:glycerophosphodiester phosphodiesterase [Listeria newyorkensis]|uniref:Glycerophosphodiester phosphodiesterase n=1 Tax=Listeria newyorkensis TaxID=1497681 RepID=A0A841YSF0_9LIST|nr:glycerophosphodiester phosphodiesterase [Listeria newyorkensis]MBC1456320.1 glycerophosphodiester phosphodiesterase [Listeria newyorkensis]
MTEIFAHRGSKGLYPENTMPAFLAAVKAGADGIELDVQLTKDGIPVVIHDETVNRTTNGSGLVKDFTLREIQKLDAHQGYKKHLRALFKKTKIPTLEEVLVVLGRYPLILNIELKTDAYDYPGIEEKVLELCEKWAGRLTFLFCSFNLETLARLRALDDTIKLSAITKLDVEEAMAQFANLQLDSINPPYTIRNQEVLANVATRCWTANKVSQMETLFDENVRGFMTDFPEKAVEIRRGRNK